MEARRLVARVDHVHRERESAPHLVLVVIEQPNRLIGGEAPEKERAIPLHLLRVVAVEKPRLPGTGQAQVPHSHRHIPGHGEIAIPGQAHRHAHAQRAPGMYSALCRRRANVAPGARFQGQRITNGGSRHARHQIRQCRVPGDKTLDTRWDAPGVGAHGYVHRDAGVTAGKHEPRRTPLQPADDRSAPRPI